MQREITIKFNSRPLHARRVLRAITEIALMADEKAEVDTKGISILPFATPDNDTAYLPAEGF